MRVKPLTNRWNSVHGHARRRLLAPGLLAFGFDAGQGPVGRLGGCLAVMLLVARLRLGETEVDVEQTLDLGLVKVFGQGDLGGQETAVTIGTNLDPEKNPIIAGN